ncbi:hypothetical protein [Falsiroseomonas tokyonensis]|uniref:hypothetical protein n=1 Tax=Falsiroseomonas tokyonensis TaxID=430521 RepID=UPI001C208E10|nr:hypothetical protein [Falsiroseomonas tokyonensis]
MTHPRSRAPTATLADKQQAIQPTALLMGHVAGQRQFGEVRHQPFEGTAKLVLLRAAGAAAGKLPLVARRSGTAWSRVKAGNPGLAVRCILDEARRC